MEDLSMVNRWEAENGIINFVEGKTGNSIVDLGKMHLHQLSKQHALARFVMFWLSRLPLPGISRCSRAVADMVVALPAL
jgi:hypothetical protein